MTDHLTLGGTVSGWYTHSRISDVSPTQDQYGAAIAPRVGWVVPLTEGVALWPRVRGSVGLSGGDGAPDEPAWTVGADGLLVVTLARHALLDVGPRLTYARAPGASGGSVRSASLGMGGALSLVF